MKGEVGSCHAAPVKRSKKWETIRPRPTSPERDAKTAKQKAAASELQHIIAILHKWGIHSLGQLAALDKEDVANRLGPLAVRMWERANGTATRMLKFVPPPEIFAETFEFENEIETIEPLLFMLRRFLQQFSLRLGAMYLVARDLKLHITFSDKTSYEHLFKIPEPSNNVEVLFRMLHTHLEDFRSDAPIIAVSIEAQPTKASRQQFSLFESALRDPTQLSETLARLTGLLGAERVGTPVLEETHRPDVFRMEPFKWELPEVVESAVPSGPALRRLRSANAATVLLDENKPAHLRSAELQGEVVAEDGPFRASGNWWDEKQWARAEWDLQLGDGAICRCHEEANAWQMDGIYD
jgi:protein ImuB